MENTRCCALEAVLCTGQRPSEYFRRLRGENALCPAFAELAALIGVPQPPAHHAEGDVWEHTMLVLDAAAALRPQAQQPFVFMLSALCHDLGKPAVTAVIDGRIRALGHEAAGLAPARALLGRHGVPAALTEQVCNMITLHMRPNLLAAQSSGVSATNRLFRKSCCPADLVLLAAADRNGRLPARPEADAAAECYLRRRLALFEQSNEKE